MTHITEMKKLIFIDTCIRAGYAIHQGHLIPLGLG